MVSISKVDLESLREQLKNCSFEKSQLQSELFKANETLHSNEEYFRLVLENSQDLIFSIDRQYRLVSCNKNYRQALRSATGVDVKIGVSILIAEFPPEQQELRQKNFNRVLAGESLRVEFQMNLDEELHFFDYNLNPIKNSRGETIGVVGIIHDITGLKKVEKALKVSVEHLRAIADYAYGWESWVGPDGKLIWVNQAVTRMTGYTVDECKEMQNYPIPLISVVDRERIAAHFKDALEGSSGNDVEFRIQHKDGTQKWGAVSWQPIFDSDGISLGHRSSIRDITDRKKAQEALKKSEVKYRLLHESITDAFAQVDMQGKFVEWNESYKKMLGFNDEDLANCTYLDITSPKWRAFEQNILENQVLPQGYSNVYEKEYIKKDGSILPVELRTILLKDDAGTPSGMWAFVRNISERKSSERALLESENRYRDLFENSPISLWEEDFSEVKIHIDNLKSSGVVDLRSYFESHPEEVRYCLERVKILAINRATLNIYKVPNKNTLIENLSTILNQKTLCIFREELLTLAEGKKTFKSEAVNQTLQGDTIHISLSLTMLPVYENTWSKIIVSIVDITERKIAENALRESEEIMRYIIKHDPNAIAVFDRNLHYIATSDRYLQDYKVKEQQIIGKHHYEVFPEMPQVWKDIHHRVLKGEIVRNDDDSFTRSDGSITYNRWECRPWYNAGGQIGGMIMYTEVTTERKLAELALISEKEQLLKANHQLDKANARLKELDELKNKFVSIASHELRTPIVSIIGFSQTLLSDDIPLDNHERSQYLHIIEKESKRLGALVKNLLDIAKIESGGAELNFEEFNIADLARETIDSVLIPAQLSVGVERVTTVEPKVFAARERIRQVIRNLLDNAIRHTAPGGSITISIGVEQEDVIVSVKDTGTGIPESELSKIFERFHRVKGDRGAKGEGTGLGLAIAKEIIQAHDGRIWVESKLGTGSTFFFHDSVKKTTG